MEHDFILGMNWKNDHKTKIDMETDTVRFEYQRIWHIIITTQREQVPIILLNKNTADYDCGLLLFAISIHSIETRNKVSTSEAVNKILQKYKNVFSEELLNHLPSEKQIQVKTGLFGNKTSLNMGVYGISQTEFEKVCK